MSALTSNVPQQFSPDTLWGAHGQRSWRRTLALLVAISVPVEGWLWFALEGHWVFRFTTVVIWTLLYEEARSTSHLLIAREPQIRDPSYRVAYRILLEALILLLTAVVVTTHPDSPWQLDPFQGRIPVFAVLTLFVAFSLPDLVVLWSASDAPFEEDIELAEPLDDE